jgi:hypothetical protein
VPTILIVTALLAGIAITGNLAQMDSSGNSVASSLGSGISTTLITAVIAVFLLFVMGAVFLHYSK